MSDTTTAPDVLELIESADLAALDEAKGNGVLKGILIAVGVAVIAAAIATIFSRRSS
jgi:uncharacterized membrane protein (DUF485 family)